VIHKLLCTHSPWEAHKIRRVSVCLQERGAHSQHLQITVSLSMFTMTNIFMFLQVCVIYWFTLCKTDYTYRWRHRFWPLKYVNWKLCESLTRSLLEGVEGKGRREGKGANWIDFFLFFSSFSDLHVGSPAKIRGEKRWRLLHHLCSYFPSFIWWEMCRASTDL
jgi:hypothetical protein